MCFWVRVSVCEIMCERVSFVRIGESVWESKVYVEMCVCVCVSLAVSRVAVSERVFVSESLYMRMRVWECVGDGELVGMS